MNRPTAWNEETATSIVEQAPITLPPSSALAQDVYDKLRTVTYALESYSRTYLRVFRLTVPQYDILRHASREGVPLSEISASMMCDNSNLTAIVDRLAAEGLVERHVANYDRRVRLVRLTEAGAEKLRSVGPHYADAVTRLLVSLSEGQTQQLRDLLNGLRFDKLQAMQAIDSQTTA